LLAYSKQRENNDRVARIPSSKKAKGRREKFKNRTLSATKRKEEIKKEERKKKKWS